jgi:hypothetical protein
MRNSGLWLSRSSGEFWGRPKSPCASQKTPFQGPNRPGQTDAGALPPRASRRPSPSTGAKFLSPQSNCRAGRRAFPPRPAALACAFALRASASPGAPGAGLLSGARTQPNQEERLLTPDRAGGWALFAQAFFLGAAAQRARPSCQNLGPRRRVLRREPSHRFTPFFAADRQRRRSFDLPAAGSCSGRKTGRPEKFCPVLFEDCGLRAGPFVSE